MPEHADSVLMFDDADTPRSAIYQALGAASVCWESMAGTGVFDDKRACEVAEALIQRLADFGLQTDGRVSPDPDQTSAQSDGTGAAE